MFYILCPNSVRFDNECKDYGGLTQFRMLPVRCGDAYLLKSARGSYLVDGGVHSGFLPEMLYERTVGKIRAAICTYPSPERLGGILDLMEKGYKVSEYWLPDWAFVMPMLACGFNGDWPGWFDLCEWPVPEDVNISGCSSYLLLGRGWLESAATLVALGVAACSGRAPVGSRPRQIVDNSLTILSEQVAGRVVGTPGGVGQALQVLGQGYKDWGGVEDVVLLCGRLLYHEAEAMVGSECKGRKLAAQGIALAVMTMALSVSVSGDVRYFRQTGQLEDSFVPRHPFKIVNGVEVRSWEGLPPRVTPENLLSAACCPFAKGKGLVLRYGDGCCGALFCGDTTLSFLNRRRSLMLDHPTVVTAPRQGGSSADQAYKYILSVNPEKNVWVRSHYSYACKVSDAFKELPNKVCLNNCTHRTMQEVLLSFTGRRWDWLAGGGCVCG
ncbi:hypothetical protein [uncultured Pseudodesulfovibrio sp.]|uniref:hypothetical protein n=1 Tax=uncultured Pseudodesulfovibrio sp. TaxID=2035858 RepID=UPI0029C91436|nr:hypothetical protein [uncultured Pseudodesulfovibrio sp.]